MSKDTKLRASYEKYKSRYKELKKEGHAMYERMTFSEYKEAVSVLKIKSSYKGKNYSKTLAEGGTIVSKSRASTIRRILKEELGEDIAKKDIMGLNVEAILSKYNIQSKTSLQGVYLTILNSSGRDAADEAFGY